MKGDIENARAKLPLRRYMEQHGHNAGAESSKKQFRCSFCDHETGTITEKGGRQWFKCWNPACRSDTAKDKGSWDEVGYLAFVTGLSREEAFKQYLKEAGVWREEAHAPSILPGQRRRKKNLPTEKTSEERGADGGRGGSGEDEELIAQCVEVIKAERKASVSLLQRRLRLGYTRAARIMAELSRRGLVGPANGMEPRPILMPLDAILEAAAATDAPPTAPAAETPAKTPTSPDEKIMVNLFGGDEGGGGGGGGEDDPPQEPSGAVKALREFYERLTLSMADAELIWKKRGLPPSASEAFGFKSSPKSNQGILEELAERYEMDDLLEAGLFFDNGESVVPAAQLYGYGNTGKKNDQGEIAWSWTAHPILIPYFDEGGEIVGLRPHKGGLKGKESQLYIARFSRKHRESQAMSKLEPVEQSGTVVLTEGEFKACAIVWATAGYIQSAAVPGISTAKNWTVQSQIKDWLRRENARKAVVAFDNEDKGNPKYPGYKADKRKRFDTQVWARFLAIAIDRWGGFEARVCQLPEKWRGANGKADWDGALSTLVNSGFVEIKQAEEQFQREGAKADREFIHALQASVAPKEFRQAKLFKSDEESIIQNELERKFYVPRLPYAGDGERKTAQKLRRLAATKCKEVPSLGLWSLADQYRDVDGGYYTFRDLSDKERVSVWTLRRDALQADKPDHDLVWVYETKLKGYPTLVSDFEMECFFTLKRNDGNRDRVVTLRNSRGEKTGLVRLDSESFSTPSKFRPWLMNQGNFAWRAGERELQDLQLDTNHAAYDREVHEVPLAGHHEESGLFFMGDSAFPGEGQLQPDDQGIYWHNGTGYLQGKKNGKPTDGEGQNYLQLCPGNSKLGLPDMHPSVALQMAPRSSDGEIIFELRSSAEAKEEKAAVKNLMALMGQRLCDVLGGMEGFMAMGMMLAYYAAPEFFRRYGAWPGLWVHGERQQGKTTLIKWLMEIAGFHRMESGLGLQKVTPVGMQIATAQYSEIPVWVSEFREHETEKIKRAMLQGAFNREPAAKWSPDGIMRRVRTGYIVDGESTSTDAATMQRYAHILVAENRRQEDHWQWFEDNRCFFLPWGGKSCDNERSFLN